MLGLGLGVAEPKRPGPPVPPPAAGGLEAEKFSVVCVGFDDGLAPAPATKLPPKSPSPPLAGAGFVPGLADAAGAPKGVAAAVPGFVVPDYVNSPSPVPPPAGVPPGVPPPPKRLVDIIC